ncbi:MAG: tetratricopeptide repeat protein [bacterium]|nr:tetratricopeptide repeat protein [bacterium]
MAAKTKTSPCTPPPGLRTRPSRSTRWRVLVLILVHVAIALHVVHWSKAGRTLSPLEPSEAMEFSKESVVNAGLVLFVLMGVSTVIFGRFFCGWACHLVALQDLSRSILVKLGIRPRPLKSRLLALVPFIAFVYMFLWPIAYRLWIKDDFAASTELYKDDFWATFPPLPVAIATLVFCGFASVYFLGSKGFCTYACPYGAVLMVADKVSPTRIRVTDACEGCGHCTIACTSNVAVAQEVLDYGMVVDTGCMKCLDCVSVCPKDALYLGVGKPALGANPRREIKKPKRGMPWGEEILLGVAFILGVLAFRNIYAAVPFLFSLGIAGVAAFLVLRAWHLVKKDTVKVQNFTLKEAGKVTSAGKAFSLLFAGFLALWAHSGYIRYNAWQSDRTFDQLIDARMNWFIKPELAPEQEELARTVRQRSKRVLDAGLLPDTQHEILYAWSGLFLGDDDSFVEHMTRARELAPRNPIISLELGHHRRQNGDIEAAVAHYERAALAEPRFIDSYEMLGQLLMPERHEEFRAIIERGLEKDPRATDLHWAHATLLAARNDLQGSVAAMETALEIDPENLRFRIQLAIVFAGAGRGQDAVALLEEGIALSPDRAEPLRALAGIHLRLRNPQEAERACQRAFDLGSQDPSDVVNNHRTMARIRAELGDDEGAQSHLQRAQEAAGAAAAAEGS